MPPQATILLILLTLRLGAWASDLLPACEGFIIEFETHTEDQNMVVLPLKRAGNLVLLEAQVNGIPGNLILDSGSSSLVLNSIWFTEEARPMAAFTAGGITGSTGKMSRMIVDNIRIQDMNFARVEANVSDLGHIESARNVRVLGFFGLSLFRDYEMVLDLRNNVLELHRLNFRGNRVNRTHQPPRFDISMPVRVESDVVFLEAGIRNSRLTFCLDTGAESNVIGSELPSRVMVSITVNGRSTLLGAGSRQTEVLHGVLDELTLQKTTFRQMQVLVTNLNTMSSYFGIPVHGMLGCEFLEKGVFHINIKRQTLGIVLY
jgi:predicted aspartyl protease